MEAKHKVEAILFAFSKEVSRDELCRLCGLAPEQVQQAVQELKQEYQQRATALHIADRNNGWKLMVKDEFLPLVTSIVTETELDAALMETLAIIAWRYPLTQAEVVRYRHNKAYEHLKQLEEAGFIMKERSGRTYKIKLAPKFFEYFDLPSKEAKQAFLKLIPEEMRKHIEEIGKAIEAVKNEEEPAAKRGGMPATEEAAAKGAKTQEEKELNEEVGMLFGK